MHLNFDYRLIVDGFNASCKRPAFVRHSMRSCCAMTLLTLILLDRGFFWGNLTIATPGRTLDNSSCTTLSSILSSVTNGFPAFATATACTVTQNPYPNNPLVKSVIQIQYSFSAYNSFLMMWQALGTSNLANARLIWTTILGSLLIGCNSEGRYSDSIGISAGTVSGNLPVTTYMCSKTSSQFSQTTQYLDGGQGCSYNVAIPCNPPPPFVASPPPPPPLVLTSCTVNIITNHNTFYSTTGPANGAAALIQTTLLPPIFNPTGWPVPIPFVANDGTFYSGAGKQLMGNVNLFFIHSPHDHETQGW